jgi:flagellar biosynthesis protein FlhG
MAKQHIQNHREQKSGRSSPPPANILWAIGGGKGGIGKSFISSSLAISLARLGKTVTLVDLDLGGANLHTLLGIRAPEASLSDFATGKATNLNSLAGEGILPGLRFISGFNDTMNIADLQSAAKNRIISALHSLPSQYVILDLGAGTSENTLDFFLAADQKIVAITPEPTSIENAYRFIKASFYRKLRQSEAELGLHNLLEAAMDSRNSYGIRSPSDLIARINELEPEGGGRLAAKIEEFHIQLLLNQVRTRDDINLGHSMKSVCRKYFGIEADYLGHIDHDNAVWQALRKRRPVLIESPHSGLVGQFMSLTKNLLNPQPLRAVV